MAEETTVRKRKPSEEEKDEKKAPPTPPPPQSQGSSIWLLAAKLLIGASIVIISLFIRGDFEPTVEKSKPKSKQDEHFIPKFEKHIKFPEVTGVIADCSREYWVQYDKWNQAFGGEKRGKCLGVACGRLVVDDICEKEALMAYNHPVGLLLKEVAELEDYAAEWDMYYNTLTDPKFRYDPKPELAEKDDEEEEIDADDEKSIEDIPVEGETAEERYQRLQLAALDKQYAKEKKANEKKRKAELYKKRVWHQRKPGVAPVMFKQKGFHETHDSTEIWSMKLYHTQLTDIMNKIPNMIMNNFRSRDFVLTYPHKFVRHAAVPEGHEPFYAEPYLVGQGYADKTNGKARYHYVDYFAIIFLNQDFEGGELTLTDWKTRKTSVIEPKFNRVVVATAGSENLVKFAPVTKGEMFYYFLAFTCDNRRNINSEGRVDDTYLPYGPMRIPKEGVTPIYINEKTGESFGTDDPTAGKAQEWHTEKIVKAARENPNDPGTVTML